MSGVAIGADINRAESGSRERGVNPATPWRLVPGRGLAAGSFLLALLAGVLLFLPGYWGFLAAGWIALALLACADWFWLRRHGPHVHAHMVAPGVTVRGQVIDVQLTIENGTGHALCLEARPELPDQGHPRLVQFSARLNPGGHKTFALSIEAVARGAYRFGDVHIRVHGPWRMLEGQFCQRIDLRSKVYPDIRRVQQYLLTRRLHDSIAPHLRTARIRGLGSEFESLRDYELGDDIRRIDWKASARHRRPIVRNYEIEPYRNVVALVDCGRLMTGSAGQGSKLDHALDAALMAAGVALDSGDRCGAMLYDDRVRTWLPPRSGLNQLRTLVDLVYDAQPAYVESNFQRPFQHLQTKLTKRSMLLVLADVIDADASAAFVTGLLALSRRHLVVFAAIRTPEVESIIDRPTRDRDDPFRKAVAYRLLKERTQVMTRLQRSGVHVLDVRPEDLTIPLVNKYIELREMNLL